jgi:hypothetical protein
MDAIGRLPPEVEGRGQPTPTMTTATHDRAPGRGRAVLGAHTDGGHRHGTAEAYEVVEGE